jgi:hypothetical protein
MDGVDVGRRPARRVPELVTDRETYHDSAPVGSVTARTGGIEHPLIGCERALAHGTALAQGASPRRKGASYRQCIVKSPPSLKSIQATTQAEARPRTGLPTVLDAVDHAISRTPVLELRRSVGNDWLRRQDRRGPFRGGHRRIRPLRKLVERLAATTVLRAGRGSERSSALMERPAHGSP